MLSKIFNVKKILGLAIYNGVILNVRFPRVVYKKLLGWKYSLEDLKEVNPAVGHSLQKLLDFEGNVEEEFDEIYFQIEYEYFGERKYHDLIEDGGNVLVTSNNKKSII
jgi:ubiquitin-protein ligase E3 A